MGAKKIGAVIALDGEKEFKQAVTSCNKSLATMKSEMNLVKAESEGQANTLENLQKKHSVLTKILEEQKNKQEAVSKGLEHAKEAYGKVGNGLKELYATKEAQIKKTDELRESYKQASDTLDEMQKSGNASKEEMEAQEAVVKTLADALKDEEAALKDVNTAISKGERNYETAGNRVQDWEAKLNNAKAQVVKANAEVNKNATYLAEAERATDKCATSIDGFGKETKEATQIAFDFGRTLKENLANTAIDVAKAAASSMTSSILDAESAQRQFQAATGTSEAQMKSYISVMNELHTNNYGEDINDVAQSMALVKQYTNELNPEKLAKMTENGIAMQDVFDMDLSETIRGVTALVTNMGVNSDQAFDLMATGAQRGLNKSGELADNIAEYSQLWGQAGFAAEDMFAILENGLESGAYNLDKVNDFVKEFTISLADGRIEEHLDSFSTETQMLFNNWKAGKVTSKDVFQSVISDLANAKNKQEALTLASDTWSALGEDNAMAVITSLNKVNDSYKNVQGTMEEIKNIKYDTLESRYKQLGKSFVTNIGTPIAEKALPAIEKGLEVTTEHLDEITAATLGIGAAVATYKIASTVEAAVKAVNAYREATQAAATAQEALNVASSANPYVLIATAIVGVTTAMIAWKVSADETTFACQDLLDENQKLIETSQQTDEAVKELTASYNNGLAKVDAQATLTDKLTDELYSLQNQSGNTTAGMARMQQIVDQLNDLYPELNLSLDEHTGKLNKAKEQTEALTGAQVEQMRAEAARKQVTEIISKQTEAELNLYMLQQKEQNLRDEAADTWAKYNEIAIHSTELTKEQRDQLAEYNETYGALTEQIDANVTAQESAQQTIDDLAEEYGAASDYLDQLPGITNTTDDLNELSQAQESAQYTAQTALEAITEKYNTATETISSLLDSQMNMFEEFNAGNKITSDEILANMQSQIDGVTNWSSNIDLLVGNLSDDVLAYLINLGPEGANYVQAFVDMLNEKPEKLEQVNDLWAQSLQLKEVVSTKVADAMTGYTEAMEDAAKTAESTTKDKFSMIGEAMGTGTTKGIDSKESEMKKTISEVMGGLPDIAKDTLQIHSPSKVFAEIGQRIPEGTAQGVNSNKGMLLNSIMNMMTEANQYASYTMDYASYWNIGYNVSMGLANGIASGRSAVVNSAINVCRAAINAARNTLQVHSPSRVFESIGNYTAEGYIKGYENRTGDIQRTVTQSLDFSELNPKIQTAKSGMTQVYTASSDFTEAIKQVFKDQIMPQIVVQAHTYIDGEEVAQKTTSRVNRQLVRERRAVRI